MDFKKFKDVIAVEFNKMAKGKLFVLNLPKEILWETYLNSFKEEDKQEHNCNACKAFITHYGKVVTINPETLEIETFWDNVHVEGYEVVAANMVKLIKGGSISNIFIRSDKEFFGCDHNLQRLENGEVITWQHLYVVAPQKCLLNNYSGDTIGAVQGKIESSVSVLFRSLTEFTDAAVDTVIELTESGNLYRGSEFLKSIQEFKYLKNEDSKNKSKRMNFCWLHYESSVSKIRNTAIGTLLINLSEDMDLEKAVAKYEAIMAPMNYKRPNALVTPKQIEAAKKTVQELGLESSLPRRHATIDDISVKNVLFVNSDARTLMKDSVFSAIPTAGISNPKAFKNSSKVNIDDFIHNILPNSQEVEVLFTNDLIPNLVTITAPVNKDAEPLFKWNNNFAWCYNGSVADSFKEKVKSAGGCIEGYLRCSLHWFNYDDLDIHVTQPNHDDICFNHKNGYTGGVLDIDMNAGYGHSRDSVENIIWKDSNRLAPGIYTLSVNNYFKRETIDVGFECEIEYNSEIFKFTYNKIVPNQSTINVATMEVFKDKSISITPIIESNSSFRTTKVWNIDTLKFQRVSCIMESPNQWDLKCGNRHLFFMLQNCKNPYAVRGFFNEYLRSDLEKNHKRVFEALGSAVKSEYCEEQLSGIGFSDTTKGELIVKVDNKTYKIKF